VYASSTRQIGCRRLLASPIVGSSGPSVSFNNLIAKTWAENILFSVMVELTYKCNLDCFFCYNDLNLHGQPLTIEQYLAFLEDLRDMQVLNLILTGGEPLAHPDFFLIGSKAKDLGFVLRIKSNGHALRGRLAQRVKEEIDPFVIDMSLHGACAETHDRQTRIPGSFDRLMENIPELQALELRLKLNCTLTRWNEGEMEEMFELADRLGIRLGITPTVVPRDDGDTEPLTLTPSRAGKLKLFRLLDARSRVAGDQQASPASEGLQPLDDSMMPVSVEKNCGAGSSGITVDPFGNVLPCVQWRRPVGNLHTQSIKEIWSGSAGLEEVRSLTVEAKRKVDGYGEKGHLMGFCPGEAQVTTGDPLSLYPTATEQMDLLDQVNREQKSVDRPLLPIVG